MLVLVDAFHRRRLKVDEAPRLLRREICLLALLHFGQLTHDFEMSGRPLAGSNL